jgi:Xaa-Pro aminopeptidase
VAAHHLDRLREQALAFIAARVKAGQAVSEMDVQRMLMRGYEVRGLTGPAPVVAAGAHTADPSYAPSAATAVAIKEGDLVRIELRARLARAERPVFAETAWMAYVGEAVPSRYAEVFAVVARARDTALLFIRERARRRRAVRGHEVDAKARGVIGDAGHGERFPHRTGHSLDTALHSASVALDGYETRDRRPLVAGAGFAIAPGVYMDGEFGVRSTVTLHLVGRNVEVTMPPQTEITALLAP